MVFIIKGIITEISYVLGRSTKNRAWGRIWPGCPRIAFSGFFEVEIPYFSMVDFFKIFSSRTTSQPVELAPYSSAVNLPEGLTFPSKIFSTTFADDKGIDSWPH